MQRFKMPDPADPKWILVKFIIVGLIIFSIFGDFGTNGQHKQQVQTTKEQQTNNSKDNEDCAKAAVITYLLQNLDNPDSYKSAGWSIGPNPDNTDQYWVRHKFRAQNIYGAIVLNSYLFTVSSDFKVINVEE